MIAVRKKHRHPLSPPIFPCDWASDWGEDQYGLWMAFTYKGVRQCFRWAPPGVFEMGSPEEEDGHYGDELQQLHCHKAFGLRTHPVRKPYGQL